MTNIIVFVYENYRGETETRFVKSPVLEFKAVKDFYPEPQWFITGQCLQRNAPRSFAVKKIRFFPDV